MNNKHRKILKLIFARPTSGNIPWADIEALLMAVGAKLSEGAGSRVRFVADGKVATFHRPHPGKEAKPYQVANAREYLQMLGVKP